MAPLPHAGYFEGILQLRPATEEILIFLEKEMSVNERFMITKQKHGRHGNMDLYVSSQKVLLQLAKKLQNTFQGIVKTSRRAHTMDHMTRKSLYRVNVLFRPVTIKRGDMIKYQGEEYEVTLVDTAKVQLREPKSGKKFWIKIEDLSL